MNLIFSNRLSIFDSTQKNFNAIAAQDAFCVTALAQASLCLITKIFYQTAIPQNLPLTLGQTGVGLSIASALLSIALRYKQETQDKGLNRFERKARVATTAMPIYFSAMVVAGAALSYLRFSPLRTMIGASALSAIISGHALQQPLHPDSLFCKIGNTLSSLAHMLPKPTGAFR